MMGAAGQRLKKVRERLGLRYRDVEVASQRIAEARQNDEYAVGISRLSDIENKGTLPSIFRLYSLCAIYRLDFTEVLSWYEIRLGEVFADSRRTALDHTHPVELGPVADAETVVPLALDPGVDLKRTVFLSRVVQKWGPLPLALLSGMELRDHRYAFIGTEDWTMYPIILPGSLVLIDESRKDIVSSGWANEYERPIYFLEHKDGYVCAWCSRLDDRLVAQPHPLSEAQPMVFARNEVDVLGRVDGVAMRLSPERRVRSRK